MTQAAANLPVINTSLLDKGGADADEFRAALRMATHDLGFFYLVGRRIPDEVISETFAQATRFFALPLEDKQQVEMLNSPRFRCYPAPAVSSSATRSTGASSSTSALIAPPATAAMPPPACVWRAPTCGPWPNPVCATSSPTGSSGAPLSHDGSCSPGPWPWAAWPRR